MDVADIDIIYLFLHLPVAFHVKNDNSCEISFYRPFSFAINIGIESVFSSSKEIGISDKS